MLPNKPRGVPRVDDRRVLNGILWILRKFRREFRRGQHRHVRRGWSRDRRHIFYGAVLVGVPFGYATYASHPCYDWLAGPHGVGYYWNYYRCPV